MPGLGPGQSNLSVSQAVGAAAYFVKRDSEVGLDPSSNMFAPEQWKTQLNNVPEFTEYTPGSGTPSFNQTDNYFDLDKRSTYIGRVELHYLRGAILGHGGTYARFHDWEGYSSIDRIVIEYMNKEVLTLRGDELQLYAFTQKHTDWRTREAHLQHGHLTEHERNVLGTGTEASSTGVWTIVDLQLPFAEARKQIPIITLPNKIRVHVFMKPLWQCVISDGNGTPTCTISTMILRCHMDHVPAVHQQKLDALVKHTGYAMKIRTAEYHLNEQFTATDPAVGDQTWTLNIRNIKNYCYCMIITIRPTNSILPSALGNTLDLHNFILASSWWLEDGGSQITKVFEGQGTNANPSQGRNQWGVNVSGTLAFPDLPVGMKIMVIPFTHNDFNNSTTMKSDNDAYGGRFMIRYNNLQLKLFFGQNHPYITNGTQYSVNCYGLIHNAVFYIKGDFRKFLL